MNLILFEAGELDTPLALTDPRAAHLLGVLRRKPGDAFDAGVVDGPRGKATLLEVGTHALTLRFEAGEVPPAPEPIVLLIATPRPQTARKILVEATSLGVDALHFFHAEKAERSYASSTLWSDGEWRRRLLEGAAQAFDTRLPKVHHHAGLAEAIASVPPSHGRLALDNYEATSRLSPGLRMLPLALAFGPERGWSASERTLLRQTRFELAHVGTRVLRTETAVVAAVAIVKARD